MQIKDEGGKINRDRLEGVGGGKGKRVKHMWKGEGRLQELIKRKMQRVVKMLSLGKSLHPPCCIVADGKYPWFLESILQNN